MQLQRQIGNRQTAALLGLEAGQSLDGGVRSSAEQAYGTDFADVTIHTSQRAEALAGTHDARAVTFGRSIAFGAGQYQPGSFDTDMVLAHELAHAAQQAPDQAPGADPAADALEADADRSAAAGVAAIRGEARTTGAAAPSLRSTLQFRRCGRGPSAPLGAGANLTVAGAAQFQPGGYVTTTGSAVTVEITGVSAPPDAGAVPPGSVTWTGGAPGADQFHRLVPTGAPGTTTVTASGGGKTGSVTIYAVVSAALPAANPPATLRHILLPTPSVVAGPPGPLGLTVVTIGQQGIVGPEFDVAAYLDGSNWRFRVTEIRHKYKVGINGTGLTAISGPGDPAITPNTIGPIITALTPPSASTPPPTTPFWSPTIVRAHEQAHVDRFYNTFWPPQMQQFEREVEAEVLKFDPARAGTAVDAVAFRRAAWQTRVDQLHLAADNAEIPGSETFAHGVSNTMWLALIASIRNTVAPPAPSALTGAAAGSRSATVNWTPTNMVNTTGFVIQRQRGAGAFVDIASVGPGARSHTDRAVPPGPVTYRVLASGLAGRSAPSPSQAVTITP